MSYYGHCKDCLFWVDRYTRKHPTDTIALHECRRRSPTTPLLLGSGGFQCGDARWGVTKDDDGCGDFKPFGAA